MPALSISSPNRLSGAVFSLVLCAVALACMSSSRAQETWPPEQDVQPEQPVRRVGETTSAALRMQVEGSHAGPALPMLGPTASLSWQRYLDSYKHPIPETFVRNLDEIGKR